MKAKLIVLGSRAGEPGTWGATSGYLVVCGNTTILLDCGFGIPQALESEKKLESVDAIVITHFHADHVAGLLTLAYVQQIRKTHSKKLLLLLPPGGIELIRKWQLLFSINTYPTLRSPFEDAFELQEYGESSFILQEIRITPMLLKHAVPNYGIRLDGRAWSLTYSGDTSFCNEIIALAGGSSLLLSEATYISEREKILFGHGHLTGIQAGLVAEKAAARRLVLTHFSQESAEWLKFLKDDASLNFGGTIDLALPRVTFLLGERKDPPNGGTRSD